MCGFTYPLQHTVTHSHKHDNNVTELLLANIYHQTGMYSVLVYVHKLSRLSVHVLAL